MQKQPLNQQRLFRYVRASKCRLYSSDSMVTPQMFFCLQHGFHLFRRESGLPATSLGSTSPSVLLTRTFVTYMIIPSPRSRNIGRTGASTPRCDSPFPPDTPDRRRLPAIPPTPPGLRGFPCHPPGAISPGADHQVPARPSSITTLTEGWGRRLL